MSGVMIKLPYRSQWDADASAHQTDCGPACLSMILGGAGVDISPDGVYAFIGDKEPHEYTNFVELIGAADQNGYGMTYQRYDTLGTALYWLKRFVEGGRPVLALVKYQPWRELTGNLFSWGHFVVVVGYDDERIYVHDPLFGLWQPRSLGKGFAFTIEQFLAGWGGFDDPEENPNWACASGDRSVSAPDSPPAEREPRPITEPAAELQLDPMLRRRIKGLAGYIWSEPPDFENPAEVQFWLNRLGDWGEEQIIHQVVAGEALAPLAARYYDEQWRWPAIRHFNELAGDWVYVGQKLRIPLVGQSNAHMNPELPANSASFALAASLGDGFNPVLPAIEYDEIGRNTVGIGFVDQDGRDGGG